MSELWSFIRQKSNREILGWAGGGLVVLATGLWVAFTYAFPPSKSSSGVSADCSSVAIGGNVTGVVTAGGSTDCSRKPTK
ncbi:MAG: hypothetical protein WCE79_13960 [Xanthobacteraceae bacterium]